VVVQRFAALVRAVPADERVVVARFVHAELAGLVVAAWALRVAQHLISRILYHYQGQWAGYKGGGGRGRGIDLEYDKCVNGGDGK
jgi:hypothetical protein